MAWRITCDRCPATAEEITCREALVRVMQHGPHPGHFTVTMTGRNE